MNVRSLLALTALALVLAPLPAPAGEPGEPVLEEGWYVVRLLGKPAGYEHEITTRTTLDGRPALLTKTEQRMPKRGEGAATVEGHTTETWTTEDCEFLKMRVIERDGEQEQRLFAERVGDEIRVRRELNDGGHDTTVAIPAGTKVYDGIGGHVLVLLGLEVGKKHTVTAFSDMTIGLATETAVIEGRRSVESLGKTVDAFIVKLTTSDMPGVTATALCDAEGRLLHLTVGPLDKVRATRSEALAALEAAQPDESLSSLPLVGALAAWSTLDAVTVEAKVAGAGADEAPLFADDDYQTVTAAAGRYRLELRALPAPERAAQRLPIVPASADFRRYCEPALFMQSDAPEIRAEAERVLAGDRDPLSAARKLCRTVFVKLKKERAAASTASALETLRAGVGDCTEHAALFCALARAAGLPAREAYGVTLRAADAGYHAWAEVLIDGRWVPVDATIDAVGLPPAYIRLGTSDGNDRETGGLALMARLIGRLELAIVSATRRGVTFDPRDRAQVARRDGDLWRDLGGDFVVDLSGGWELQSAEPPDTVLMSPTGQAIVVTVAEVTIRSDEDWGEFERGFAATTQAKLELESRIEDDGREARTYRYVMTTQGQEFEGLLRVVIAGSILWSTNAIVRADMAEPGDVGKVLARVKLGDAAR